MPNRRRKEKGSFGGSFDELIKVFPDEPAKDQTAIESDQSDDSDDRHINDKLFEAAWRKSREGKKPSSRP